MVTVKRANVVLTVEADEVEKYFEKGYSVIDENGNVIKASAPTEVGALQKALQDKDVEIAKLKKELEKAKSQNKVQEEPKPEKRPYNKKNTEQ